MFEYTIFNDPKAGSKGKIFENEVYNWNQKPNTSINWKVEFNEDTLLYILDKTRYFTEEKKTSNTDTILFNDSFDLTIKNNTRMNFTNYI